METCHWVLNHSSDFTRGQNRVLRRPGRPASARARGPIRTCVCKLGKQTELEEQSSCSPPHPAILWITSAALPSQFPVSEPSHMFHGHKMCLYGNDKLWSEADCNQSVLRNRGSSPRNAKQTELEGKNERCGLRLMWCTFCLTTTLCRVYDYSSASHTCSH